MPWWRLTPEEAIAIAREHAEGRGLPWVGPVKAIRKLHGGWDVKTNAPHRGGNVWVHLDRYGEVRKSAHVPR